MSLSSEDYENIWLRLKEKFAKWVTGYLLLIIFLPITVLTTVGMNKLVDYRVSVELDKKIDEKINSQDFASEVTRLTSNKLLDIDTQVNKSYKQIKRLEEKAIKINRFLADFPISFDGNRLSILSNTGDSFILEKGNCVKIGKIMFSKAFSEIPTVIISDCNDNVLSRKLNKTFITHIDVNSFTLNSRDFAKKVSWIAIGQ